MSNYERHKVFRIPVTEEDKKAILEKYNINHLSELEYKLDNFKYGEVDNFQTAPTKDDFIDYVTDIDYYTDIPTDFCKVYPLADIEKRVIGPKFKEIYEGFDVDKIRKVDFNWYNSNEAPSYYEFTDKDNPFDLHIENCYVIKNSEGRYWGIEHCDDELLDVWYKEIAHAFIMDENFVKLQPLDELIKARQLHDCKVVAIEIKEYVSIEE